MPEKEAPRILVIEDERNLARTLVDRLKAEGYEVIHAGNLEEALFEVKQRYFDLAIVDVGLPDGSGFDLAQLIRESNRSTGIIFLTAFGSSEDRVKGLEMGAEDYIVKPFHLKELLLRIRNGLKRAAFFSGLRDSGQGTVQVGRAQVHFPRFEAEVNGRVIPLTHKECSLLKLLVERKGQVVSRDEILNFVWSENEFPTSRTVDNFIMRLRRLVEINPEQPEVITSVRGVGYQLNERK